MKYESIITHFLIFLLGGFLCSNTPIKSESKSENNISIGNCSVEDVGKKVDINSANVKELECLLGVGEKKAEEIISNRPYEDVYELLEKNILGDRTFEKNKCVLVAGD